MKRIAACVLLALCTATGAADPDAPVRAARERWEKSPHGEMLTRIIPPYLEPSRLPEPASDGARLTARYCVQCHNLASPAMHDAGKWPAIVERMLPRMQGRGNLGPLMQGLMADLQAPRTADLRSLVAYLQKHGQARIEPDSLPEAGRSRAWTSYTQACGQCHTLPDPQRHTRGEWPGVVARMEKNMQWMNRVIGSRADPREPQYRSDEIVGYLQKYARR